MTGWNSPECDSGKAAFRTRGLALAALRRIVIDNAQAAAPVRHAPHRAYRCDCGAWHLTKQPTRERAAR